MGSEMCIRDSCYVMNKTMWDDRPDFSWPATSVPYFDDKCGIVADEMEKFDQFINMLDTYQPRDYIVKNHTLEISAKNYIKILEEMKNGL